MDEVTIKSFRAVDQVDRATLTNPETRRLHPRHTTHGPLGTNVCCWCQRSVDEDLLSMARIAGDPMAHSSKEKEETTVESVVDASLLTSRSPGHRENQISLIVSPEFKSDKSEQCNCILPLNECFDASCWPFRRKVQFAPTLEIVKEIPNRNTFTSEEKQLAWWTRREQREFRSRERRLRTQAAQDSKDTATQIVGGLSTRRLFNAEGPTMVVSV